MQLRKPANGEIEAIFFSPYLTAADEAMTGTKDDREQFQLLLTDCRAGKIDMIVTKAISRFARNTVTLLETVRELKDLGVDVYFEEKDFYTQEMPINTRFTAFFEKGWCLFGV